MLLVLVLYLLVTFAGLFNPIVVNAAKYAQIGREILDNHDWINLTIGGDPYDQKPPLLFWIAAIVFRLFGTSVLAYKITVVLVSLAGIYGTFKFAGMFYGKSTGILSAVFLATSLGFLHFHNDIHTDTLLIVPVILSVWQYAAYFKERKQRQFYLGTIFAGLGMLTKGPVALVVIGAAVGVHLLATRSYKDIFNLRWVIAAPIVLLLTLPALWGLYNQFGADGIEFFFWTNNFGRISGSYHGSNTDPSFYIHTTLYMMAPWSIFCFVGIYMQIREKIRAKWNFGKTDEFYTLGAIIVYLLINSVAKAKNPHYEMVILPFLAIIAARWALLIFENTACRKTQKILGWIHIVIGILLVLLAYVFLIYVFPENKIWIWAVVLMLTAAFAYALFRQHSLNKQLTYMLISMSLFLFTLDTNVLPHMAWYHSSFQATIEYNHRAQNKEDLHIFTEDGRYWEIFLYSKNYGRYLITPEDFRRVSPEINDWLYTGATGLKLLKEMDVTVDTVCTFPHRSMSRMSPKFLNPKTRASKLDLRYLVQIKEK